MAMYHVCLSDGTLFTDVSDTTMLQMMEKLDVDNVASADTGELLYLKPKKLVGKVGGITRVSVSVRGVKEYDEPIVLPMAKEWLVVTHADIPTCSYRTDDERYAMKRFERSVSSKWYDGPFYDEVRLYHNGRVIRAAVLGHEIVL